MSKIKKLIGICEDCGATTPQNLLTDDQRCPNCDERRMREYYSYTRNIERMVINTVSNINKSYSYGIR
jgi:DNA-directed RNA polymerase subunit RPC12/RpoP